MAQNAIEILIDVLAQEGIDSTDEFVKVLTSAIDKADVLAGSVDDLDASLTVLAKSGASAEAMAAGIATAMEDAGVQFKDVDGFVTILSKSLEGLGAAGEKAAGGIDLTVKANEELAGSADAAAGAVERQAAGFKVAAIDAAAYESALKGLNVGAASSALTAGAAVENLGAGYAKMTGLAEMATPALMKAATFAGIGLAGLAYEGIKQYTQFNKLITQTITQAGEAPSKMGFLTSLAESVAKSTGQNLDDVANTIYRAASGTASWNNGLGATKKQLGDIVTQVSKLNVVGGIATGAESEQASRVVTALINSNIRGVGKSPTQAAALINAVVGSGDMRLADLVPGIGRGLLGSAVANNLSAKDALAWVATLTSQGTTASVAGNYVKTGINLLAHPSAQGVEALSMLGIKPGELENLMSGPGGLVSALSTMKQGMKQLKPSDMAKYFFHEAGAVYPGGSGLQGAVAKLQTWSAGELSPKFISDWEKNQLTPQEQTQATDLVLTKAFGGSKQFATIAAVLNNLGLVKGIESHIGAEDTAGYFNAQYRRAEATPSQQFKRMGQSLLVDLVNIGKTLTPLGLTFGHIITGVIGGLSKFKGVIEGFAILAGGLLAAAGVATGAKLLSHLAPLVGAGYNRLGLMAGEDSAFTRGMNARANSGGFSFLDIYKTKKHGILSKLGGESINAGVGNADSTLSPDGTALNTNLNKSNVYLEQIAANTRVTSAAVEEGDVTGAGGLGGKMRAAESSTPAYAPQFRDPVTGRFLSAAESAPLAARMGEEESAAQTAAMYYGATGRGRSIRSFKTGMSGGAETAAANIESTAAARESSSLLGGVDQGVGQYGPALEGGLANAAAPKLLSEVGAAGAEDLGGGLMETLGGVAGGPLGMMGMMMAPMLIGALTPAFGKLGSLLGDWLGGGSSKPFHAHIKHALDATQASAEVQKRLKILRQFQTKVKDKAGKDIWVRNESAFLADPNGYAAALKNYQLASHTYTGSIRNSNAISAQAIDALYGSQSSLLSKDIQRAKSLGGTLESSGLGAYMANVGTAAQMRKMAMQLPETLNAAGREQPLLRRAVLRMMAKHGANWQDFSKILGQEEKNSRGIFNDIVGSSAQTQDKRYKLAAALIQGGFFQNRKDLSLNTSEMNKFLGSKKTTVADAAQVLPQYATYYHQKLMADNKELANKHLPADARKYFEEQKADAEKSLAKTDALIREMRDAAEHTKLAGESVDKMARENAAQIAASGLTATQIGKAVASALSPYMRGAVVQGTRGLTTRGQTPSGSVPFPALTGST